MVATSWGRRTNSYLVLSQSLRRSSGPIFLSSGRVLTVLVLRKRGPPICFRSGAADECPFLRMKVLNGVVFIGDDFG